LATTDGQFVYKTYELRNESEGRGTGIVGQLATTRTAP